MSNDKKYFFAGHEFFAPALQSGLYIVATPIGNLKDISIRALETLSACDLILCEDTRTSAKLLNNYGIKTKKMPLHEHNEKSKIAGILNLLKENASIALISDAGTPLISDPGFPLVRAVQNASFDIFAIPGASAILASLVISGMPTDRFSFFGFLPPKTGAKEKILEKLKNNQETLLFYESPHRLLATIRSMQKIFGDDRNASIALELTKKFERKIQGNLQTLEQRLAKIKANKEQVKGEAVIIIAGSDEVIIDKNIWLSELEQALNEVPLKTAVAQICAKFSIKRKQVYDAALNIKKTKG